MPRKNAKQIKGKCRGKGEPRLKKSVLVLEKKFGMVFVTQYFYICNMVLK